MGDARARRRSAAIHAYTGPNGGGKSLAMIHDTITSLQAGRPVLSTVRLLDPTAQADSEASATAAWAALGLDNADHSDPLGLPHPLYEPLTQWHQLLDFRGGDVLLDEVQGVVSSRGHQSLPPAVVNLLLQLRRRDVLCRWTSPSYARADVVLREVTQAVTYCRGYLAEPSRGCPSDCEDPHHDTLCWFQDGEDSAPYVGCGEDQHDHVKARLWASNRWFYWRTYNALAFDEFSAGKRENLKSEVRQFYRRRAHDCHRWYDTLAGVDYIADATETGACLRCGGNRRRPACKCGDGGEEPQRSEDRTRHRTTRAVA